MTRLAVRSKLDHLTYIPEQVDDRTHLVTWVYPNCTANAAVELYEGAPTWPGASSTFPP